VCNFPVTGHLSEGLFVRNVVVQIPKSDANPNPNPKSNPNPNPSPNPNSNPNPNPSHSPNCNPMPIRFGQMTLWTSELLPNVPRDPYQPIRSCR